MRNYSILTLLELRKYLDLKSKRRCILLVLLSILSAIFDVISVASIIPFLSILIQNNNENNLVNNISFFNKFNLLDSQDKLIVSLICLSLIIIISSVTRVFTLYYANKLVARIGHELSNLVFKNTFGIDFEYLTKTDLKETTAKLVLYITKTVESLTFLTKFTTASLIASSISIFLVITKPIISFSTLLFLGIVYSFVGANSRQRMNTLSKEIAHGTESQIQTIQDIYSMSRNMYLDNSFEPISDNYSGFDYRNRKLYALSEFLGSYPRFVIEAAAIVVIACASTILSFLNSDSTSMVPFLGAFAFASQRLLPALQQIYANWAGIKSNNAFVKSISESLSSERQKVPKKLLIKDSSNLKTISFEEICFKYETNFSKNFIIKNFSAKFHQGARIAIVGPTGIGKSTLLDIISCLRWPTSGSVDFLNNNNNIFLNNNDRSGESSDTKYIPNCSFVPQFNYVLNTSLEKNISISLPNKGTNYKNLKLAAEVSLLSNFIENQPNKFEFNPSLNGFSMSGGQIQRLAIARAIYKMSPILLLDEATSALDLKTANLVMQNIFSLNHIKFIFAVTHSKEMLNYFSHIIEFRRNGELKIIKN